MPPANPPPNKDQQQRLLASGLNRIIAAHDESGRYSSDRFFVTGFLFVSRQRLMPFVEMLRQVREQEDCWGEVHYTRVRGTGGLSGRKYRTAMGWLDCLERELVSGGARAYVLVIDNSSPKFNHRIFRGHPEWGYNRFTRMALESAVRWLYKDSPPLSMRLLTDGKTRRPGGDDENPDVGDTFSTYLPRAAYWRIRKEQSWSHVVFEPNWVEDVHPGADHSACSPECELVQAADLIVSSVAAAVRGPGRKRGKRNLARRAASWIRKTESSQWKRRPALHRKFAARMFKPGDANPWPDPIPLAIDPKVSELQESMF